VIELIVLDVDGCMSDGKITYDSNENEYKSFNVKDGLAITSWINLGKKIAIITGRKSDIVTKRAKELKITYLYQGIKNKGKILKQIKNQEHLKKQNIAVIGDDLNDIKMFKVAGLSFSPNNGNLLLEKYIDIRLKASGGNGVIAEMIEYIVKKDNLLKEYLRIWE
jgi:3-deoxy-D-manno-octulosonate 8-phosphate phosphatase (KDO 8-P phosphatase)